MWWRNYLIAVILTSVLALVAILSCGRPEPVVEESRQESTVITTETGAGEEELKEETLPLTEP